jgi:tetratricopeptide (TPR) repeat protein
MRWITLAFATIYFLPALGIISKTSFWAFSVNMYFPPELTYVHLALVTLACILLFKPDLLLFAFKMPARVYYIVFGCVFILMAVFLREKVPFYGDGYFFQRDIVSNLPIKYAEVLTMLIYRAGYLLLPESSRSGAMVYRIVNTVCIIPAAIILVSFMRRLTREYIPFAVFTLLGFGANVLFFGHVENYTLVYVSMLFYLHVITRPRVNMALLGFLLGLSTCLHLVALGLVPSFLHTLWRERGKPAFWRILFQSTISFLLAFVGTVLFSFMAGMTPGQLFIEIATSFSTLFEHTGQGFFQTIFSIRHWLDIINLLFLGLPTFPVVALLIFGPSERKGSWRERNKQLILTLAAPFTLFIMLFNTPLGLARDWDIGVTALVWRTVAVFYLAKEVAPKIRLKPSFFASVGLLAFLLSLPWFIIHRFPKHGVRRFEDIVDTRTELHGTAYGYEILGRHYHDVEDYQNSAEHYENALLHDLQNWRRHYSVAMEYLNLKQHQPALSNLRRAYELNPREIKVLVELGLLYRTMEEYDSTIVMFQQAYQIDTTDIAYHHNLGCAFYWAGQYEAAQNIFTSILEKHPNHYSTTIGLVDVMIASNNLTEAKRLIARLESRYGRNQTTQRYRRMLTGEK